MQRRSKGFSAVEILMILVVIGLIGSAGWLVFNRQNTADSQQQTFPAEENKATTEEVTADAKPSEETFPPDEELPFTYIRPEEWRTQTKVSAFPRDHVFFIKYYGEVKLNNNQDGWAVVESYDSLPPGSDADIIKEDSDNGITIWRFGFADVGYGSFVPTFVINDTVYQITTGDFCPEDTPDCMNSDLYLTLYNQFLNSIRLK